jgi:hypothetical protein
LHEKHFSEKISPAKAQSAAAFLKGSSLRLCGRDLLDRAYFLQSQFKLSLFVQNQQPEG